MHKRTPRDSLGTLKNTEREPRTQKNTEREPRTQKNTEREPRTQKNTERERACVHNRTLRDRLRTQQNT